MIEPHLTPIPLPDAIPGRLFRSAMPFRHDEGELLDEAVAAGVRVVVWLTSAAEARDRTGRDLAMEYAARGLACLHLPIADFGAPSDLRGLDVTVAAAIERLRAGEGVLVHCAAGIGRTGMFLACVIGRVSASDGEASIAAVRARVPGAVETEPQRALIRAYLAGDR